MYVRVSARVYSQRQTTQWVTSGRPVSKQASGPAEEAAHYKPSTSFNLNTHTTKKQKRRGEEREREENWALTGKKNNVERIGGK